MKFENMKSKLSEVGDRTAAMASASWKATKETSEVTFSKLGEFARNAKRYVGSHQYEADLDAFIYWIHVHKPSSAPDFSNIEDKAERLAVKSRFVADQLKLFILACGANGSKYAMSAGIDPATGFAIGAANGTIIVVVGGVTIILMRNKNGVLEVASVVE